MAEDLVGRDVRGEAAGGEDLGREAVGPGLARQHFELGQLAQEVDLLLGAAGVAGRLARRHRGLALQLVVRRHQSVTHLQSVQAHRRHGEARVRRQHRLELLRFRGVVEAQVGRSAYR